MSAKLSVRLRERIRREGAISFHDWMEAALYDEGEGYYCRKGVERWGRLGDYRTSPERSRLFAATFARFFQSLYEELGMPSGWAIWEAGAGLGHFAQGVLESLARSHPQTLASTRYVIDERSPHTRALIQERLKPFATYVEYETLYEANAPLAMGIIFANELVDAFPVHRVRMRGGRLQELYVGLNKREEFAWIEADPSTPRLSDYLERADVRLAEGQLAEINLRAPEWIKRASSLLNRGYLIVVDYGAEAEELYDARLRPEGSLRAFRRHGFIEDPLQSPGEHDITSTVDWTVLKRAAREAGLEVVSFERQDKFLLRAGLLDELNEMVKEARGAAASLELSTTAREMILPGGMSESFQVLIAGR